MLIKLLAGQPLDTKENVVLLASNSTNAARYIEGYHAITHQHAFDAKNLKYALPFKH